MLNLPFLVKIPAVFRTSSITEKMVLLRQQNLGQQIKILLLQPKILLQQPNVLLTELKILL